MGDGATLQEEYPWSFGVSVAAIHAAFDQSRERMGEQVRCRVTLERELRDDEPPSTARSGSTMTADVRKSMWAPFGPTVAWPGFVERTVLRLSYNRAQGSLDHVVDWLKQHSVSIEVYCKHGKGDTGPRHSRALVRVSYFDCATGAIDHVLNMRDYSGKTIGKLSFSVVVHEVSEISVHFRRLKMVGLPDVHKSHKANKKESINPYLKYQYSRNWPAVHRGDLKAVYSETRHQTHNPEWEDLPVLRFRTSLADLFRNSIQVHVTHRAKVRHVPLARANLLFRTLVSKGRKFKEEDVIKFSGDLRRAGAKIEGKLVLTGLPRFAQGQAVRAGRPLHTEEGLVNFKPMLPWVVMPEIPICKPESESSPSSSGDGPARSGKRATDPASDDEDHKQKSLRHASHVNDHAKTDQFDSGAGTPESDEGDDNSSLPRLQAPAGAGGQQKSGAEMSLPRLNRSRSMGSLPFALDRPNHHEKHHAGALIIFSDDEEAMTPSTERLLLGKKDDERLAEVGERTGLAELVLVPDFVPEFDETNPFQEH